MGENNINLRETHHIGQNSRERIVTQAMCRSLAMHGIALTGITEAAEDYAFVRESFGASQILVTIAGCGTVWVDGEWRPCSVGQAYVSPERVFNAFHAQPGFPWRFCWVMYAGGTSSAALTPPSRPHVIAADGEPLATAIAGLHREAMGQADPAAMLNWASLTQCYAQRALAAEPRFAAVWDAVRADPGRPWNIAMLTEISGTCGEHLRRICTAQFGESPMRYVARLRMREAAALLAAGHYRVEDVAERVGYQNPFAFSTAFRRCVGAPPSSYRATATSGAHTTTE